MVQSKLVVGLMSGTSLNGIDAVLLRVQGSGTSTKFTQLAHIDRDFPRGVREMILRNSAPESSRVDDICRLNMLLAGLYAEAVRAVARKAGVRPSAIDLIGSHGQTIHHLPRAHRMAGRPVKATLQIGDPSALAKLTGVCVVGDFRVADMAVGGQGAPLVPYFDWLVFRSKTKNRILLNIGGIANITALPKNCSPDEVVAFDTGPGNMVIDALTLRFYGKPFDRYGNIASSGRIVETLFHWMQRHPYLRMHPPKSTGREEFGVEFVGELLARGRGRRREDIVATASLFTAYAIHYACSRFIKAYPLLDELIVSGGGAKNRRILAALWGYFGVARVRLIEEFQMTSVAKEATCFAILANETMAGNPTNLCGATGAKRKVVLGKICPAD